MVALKHELKTFLFIIAATGISLFVLTRRDYIMNQHVFSETLPFFSTPTPTVTPPLPVQITTSDSPDGIKTLTMKKQQVKNLIKYSFFVSDKSNTEEQFIFGKEEYSSQSLSIPYNSWSPDNIYVFLKESTPTVNNYYVLFTSGKSFSDNSQYVNIQDLFTQKVPHYTLEDVTGWAAPNLLIVNTKTDQGKQGPSFWFELPSQSFIQLGTLFD